MKKMYHGACFYPELWDENTINQDIQLMKKAGINLVRMGEFSWSSIEPAEGKRDSALFKNVIQTLYENGIDTIMCTPTPTPPIWMTHGYEERLFVNREGQKMNHGSRQHICTNQPYFRGKAADITKHLAEELGNLPGVIAWQLDNEFKSHVAECFCCTCKGLWHEWLAQKFNKIERLNEEWGTHIWSQHYQSFEQVPQPAATPFLHNSSLVTNYQLFSMEKLTEFANEQAEIIRQHCDKPVTHNGSIAFQVDNEQLFRELDFASYDTYASQENMAAYLINCDYWRNVKKRTGFWVMETSPSHSASLAGYASPHPNGYVKAEAVAAYALGAEGFCYWLWRQQKAGSEQPHGSIISAWGAPTIGFEQVKEVEGARKELEPILLNTKPLQAEAAVTYSDRAKVFLQTEPHQKLQYRSLITDFYERILMMGIHRDLLPEQSDLTGYKLLFTPFVHYLSNEYIDRARQFAETGGIWIAGPLTGGRTKEHTIHTETALGYLEKAAKVKTLYTYPIDGTNSIGTAFGEKAPLSLWSAVFEDKEDQTVGRIEQGISEGHAFITENKVGTGKIVMLGSMPAGEAGDRMLQKLIQHYAEEAGLQLKTDVSKGTIVAPRHSGEGNVWIVVNMDGKGGSVTLPADGIDLLTQLSLSKGTLEVGPYEYAAVQF